MKLPVKLWNFLKAKFRQIDLINRHKAINDLEWEVRELKHIFALLTIGQFVGLPSTPLPIALMLLPDMQEEFSIMLARIDTASAPLSEQFSRLDTL
jgi:hypothetical protein